MRTYEQRLKNIRAKAKANKRAKRTIAATLVTMSAIALLIYGTLFAEPLRDADTPTNGPALMQPTQPTHMDAPTEPTDVEIPPTAGTRPTQTEPSETTPNDPIGKQVYDITIAGIFNQDIIRKQIQRFNETNEHGILFHVTFEDFNEDQMVDVFANGSANVDIFCFETADTERLIGLKALSALEDDVAAAVSVANVPISVNAVMCNSTLYAYPMSGGQGVAMYYDKSVISEEDTKSIESLLSACEANNRDFAIQLRNAWFLMSFFVSTGCVSEWQVDENGEFVSCYDTFNSEEGMIAARCIQKILNSPSHVDSLNIMNDSGEPAAVLISGAWSYYDAKAALGDNLGIAVYPSFTVDETTYQLSMSTDFTSLGVRPQEDPERETALHLLAQYLTGEICQQEQLTEHYLLPTNLAVRESEGNLSDPLYSAIIKQGEYARILGEKHASWWDYTVLIAEEIKNGIDLQSVLEAHQKRVESLIKVYSDAFTVIGTINDDWWRIDLPMQQQVDGKWVTVDAYTMDAGTQFKVRQNEQWQVCYPIEGNFVVEEAGTYFIALDPTTGTITLLEVEQMERPEPDTPAEPVKVSASLERFEILDGIVFGPLMISSYDELLALMEQYRPSSGVYQKLQQYDSTFFEENALVFVDYSDIVGGYDYRVKAVWKLPNGNIHVEIDKLYDFAFSEATSHDTILIELNTSVSATAQVSVETTVMPQFWDSESPETCYPLIVVENGHACIMGAYSSSWGYYSACDFQYDDKWLSEYYGLEVDAAVTSPIINMELPLFFQGTSGSFTAHAVGMTVKGEFATENYWVKLQLDCEIPDGLYYGTYSCVDIWPDNVTRDGQMFNVDMDSDGDLDTVKWGFEKSDGVYACVFTVEGDGKATSFERWREFFGYADIQVIPVDINQDGYMELIVWEKTEGGDSGVSIYGLDFVGYIERLHYTISSMP